MSELRHFWPWWVWHAKWRKIDSVLLMLFTFMMIWYHSVNWEGTCIWEDYSRRWKVVLFHWDSFADFFFRLVKVVMMDFYLFKMYCTFTIGHCEIYFLFTTFLKGQNKGRQQQTGIINIRKTGKTKPKKKTWKLTRVTGVRSLNDDILDHKGWSSFPLIKNFSGS